MDVQRRGAASAASPTNQLTGKEVNGSRLRITCHLLSRMKSLLYKIWGKKLLYIEFRLGYDCLGSSREISSRHTFTHNDPH